MPSRFPDPRRITLVLLSLLFLFPRTAMSDWSTSPSAPGVEVAFGPKDQESAAAVPDGAGGTIVSWREVLYGFDSYDAYLQRLDARGNPLWGVVSVPLPICPWDHPTALVPDLAPDGSGGAIVAFETTYDYGARAQAFNPSGGMRWGQPAVPVDLLIDHRDVCIRTNGSGFSYVFWRTTGSGTLNGLYVQRLEANGAYSWGGSGVKLRDGNVSSFAVAADGSGGWVVASTLGGVVAAQRVDANGTLLWPAGGVIVRNTVGSTANVDIAATAPGEVVVVWEDARSGPLDLYAQRLDLSGSAHWPAQGAVVCNAEGTQRLRRDGDRPQQTVPDGAGGVFVAWRESRFWSDGHVTVYVQHLSSTGEALWNKTYGYPIAPGYTYASPIAVSDGAGGMIVVWGDQRDSGGPLTGVYGQRTNPDGYAQWEPGGEPIRRGAGLMWPNAVVPLETGGVVVYWQGISAEYDLWAGKVDANGRLGTIDPAITAVEDVPNDQGGFVRIDWTKVSLDSGPPNPVGNYVVWRQGPSTWENVATVPATGAGSYSIVVATTRDSMPDSNPPTVFRVTAYDSDPLPPHEQWNSRTASGYSVDDLAPAKPRGLQGTYAGGTSTLWWDPNPEADLAGYRIYRGPDAAFVPSPANLLVEGTDPAVIDIAGASYVYTVTALDVHGNESPANVLAPGGVVGAGSTPPALAFAPPVPNPVTASSILLRFTLPRPSTAGFALYTPAGRRVRTVAPTSLESGDHALSLPLVDDAGARLASGIYVVRLETAGQSVERRIVVLR